MKTLFNDGWQFAEFAIDEKSMFNGDKPVLFTPDQFFDLADEQKYVPVRVPHDWMISHVKDLYKNSVGFYKKSFTLTAGDVSGRHCALRFEAVYMNSAVWVNGRKAGEWKYGYSTFEFDISSLIHEGENEVLVIVVYQNCNTRWYSGAGIIRDVYLINTPQTYLASDGVYFNAVPVDKEKLDGEWKIKITSEITHTVAEALEATSTTVTHKITDLSGCEFARFEGDGEFTVTSPHLWDITDPYFYILTTTLCDVDGNELDEISQHCGFKFFEFTADQGFFLNGRHQKIYG